MEFGLYMLYAVSCLFIVRNMAGVDESPVIEDVIEDVIETVHKVIENNVDSNAQLEKTERLLKFPLTRIKTIMKTDSDVTIASLDAVVLIAKATVRPKALHTRRVEPDIILLTSRLMPGLSLKLNR